MKYALFGLLLLGLVGCVKETIPGRADPDVRRQIHFTDPELANKTAVSPPIMERRNGILYVTVPVRSARDRDFHVDWRVTFFNENGVPIEGPSSWSGVTLPANTPAFIKVNSTNANAADFQMDIRWAQ